MSSDKSQLIYDMPFDEYAALPYCSQSKLNALRRSPAHLLVAMQHPSDDKPAQILGRAIHCLVLEPDLFNSRFAMAPDVDRRLKAGREIYDTFLKDIGSKTPLSRDDWDTCFHIAESVRGHETAAKILNGAKTEVSLVWEHPATKVMCKGRLDALNANLHMIADVKSTLVAHPRGFAKNVWEKGYHRQAAFYLDGAKICGLDAPYFEIIAVEKSPPYALQIFNLSKEVLALAKEENDKLLATYAECLRTDTWPGYPSEIQELGLPPWAKSPSLSTEQLEEY